MARSRVSGGISLALFILVFEAARPVPAAGWGAEGHALVTRAAVAVADQLPGWFRDEVTALAARHGLALAARTSMPANNLALVFRRR